MTAPNHVARYSSFDETISTLEGLREHCGLTPYRIGKLLGMNHPGNCYQWFDGQHRPSPKYCIRLLRLVQMKAFEGANLSLVETVT